jgi:hypothetical protein
MFGCDLVAALTLSVLDPDFRSNLNLGRGTRRILMRKSIHAGDTAVQGVLPRKKAGSGGACFERWFHLPL